MSDHDQFDRLLDKGLSEYASVTPRAGLEQRLLARLATPEAERRWNWHWIWAAVPALAVILIVIFFTARPNPKHEIAVSKAPSSAQPRPIKPRAIIEVPPAPPPQVATVRPQARVQSTSTIVRNESVNPQPKLATFPSPDENQQQARLLLRFVTRTPNVAAQVASEQEEFQKLAEARMNQDLEDRSER